MPFDGSKLDDVTLALVEGKRRLEECGWHQGDYVDPSGSGAVCVLGSLGWKRSWDENGEWHPVEYAAAKEIARHVACCAGAISYIPVWNDAGNTSQDEILRAFERAIADRLNAVING